MDTEPDSSPLLVIACRFVPYDQWLITHVDTSWRIKQLKLWLLSKCDLTGHTADIDLPRYRPNSPITFATGKVLGRHPDSYHRHHRRRRRRRRQGGSEEEGEGEDGGSGSGEGEGEEEEDLGSEESAEEEGASAGALGRTSHESFEYGYSYSRSAARRCGTPTTHSAQLSISSTHPPTTSTGTSTTIPTTTTITTTTDPKTNPKTTTLASLYTLLTFSTSQILEDEFTIAWYHLRPYELIEMHPAGGVISLPREIMNEYVMPYFQARVRALRVVGPGDGDRSSGGGGGGGGGKKIQKGRKGREGDLVSSGGSGKMGGKDKKGAGKGPGKVVVGSQGKQDVAWKDRWVVIHKGMLNLCKYHMDPNPTHTLPLSRLIALRGFEHLTRTRAKPPPPPHPQTPISPPTSPLYPTSPGGYAHPHTPISPTSPTSSSSSSSANAYGNVSSNYWRTERDRPSVYAAPNVPGVYGYGYGYGAGFVPSFDPSSTSTSTSTSTTSASTWMSTDSYCFPDIGERGDGEGAEGGEGEEGKEGERGQFVVCAKFRYASRKERARERDKEKERERERENEGGGNEKEKEKEKIKGKGKEKEKGKGKMKMAEGTEVDGDTVEPEDGEGEGSDDPNADGDWIVLDMLEENAFTSILRILHRHSPHTVSSSFLPAPLLPTSSAPVSAPNQAAGPGVPETEVFASATTPTPTPTMSSIALPPSSSPPSAAYVSSSSPPSSAPTKTMEALSIPSPLWSSSTSTLNSPTPTQDSTSRPLPITSSATSSAPASISASASTSSTAVSDAVEAGTTTSQSLTSTPKPLAPPPPPLTLTLPLPLSLPLGTLPYPEWRIRTVNKAHQSGMGDVSRAMEWVLRQQAQAIVVGEGEGEGEGEVVRRGSVGSGYGFEETEDGEAGGREEEVDDDNDVSDLEWEGWARDLERQCRVHQAEEADKEDQERRRKSDGSMRIKVDNGLTTRSWVVAPSPKSKWEHTNQPPLTFATPFEQPTFTSPFDVSDSPPPTPLSPLPISPPSLPSLTPPPSLSPPPPPAPVDMNAPEHHGTTAGAHYNQQYHPYTFRRRSVSPLSPGEVGAGAGEQGDEHAIGVPLSPTSSMSMLPPPPPPRITHTITSTVSVGLGNGEAAEGGSGAGRRRSSTISVPSRLLRKKENKDKDKDKGKGKKRGNEQEMERERMKDKTKGKAKERAVEREDDKTTLRASTSSKDTKKAKLASVVADLAVTSSVDPHLDSHWLTQSIKGVVPDPYQPPPPPAPRRPSSSSTTTLRHARSQSNLQMGTNRCKKPASNGTSSSVSSPLSHIPTREPATQEPSASITAVAAAAAPGGSGGKKRSKIVRGVSVHAERFVRGLDSALDFVDGRTGS